MFEDTLAALRRSPVVVCIRWHDPEVALEAARAAVKGGLRTIEVTLTTPAALEIIGELSKDERLLVGAGTVMTPLAARQVARAGARFAMSPVTDPDVMGEAHGSGVLFAPGTSTPNEIVHAFETGARLVKVFPIGALGGAAYLRAVRGPLPDIPLLPTNGVTLGELPAYFEAGATAVGVGSAICDRELLIRRDWPTIRLQASRFAQAVSEREREG